MSTEQTYELFQSDIPNYDTKKWWQKKSICKKVYKVAIIIFLLLITIFLMIQVLDLKDKFNKFITNVDFVMTNTIPNETLYVNRILHQHNASITNIEKQFSDDLKLITKSIENMNDILTSIDENFNNRQFITQIKIITQKLSVFNFTQAQRDLHTIACAVNPNNC